MVSKHPEADSHGPQRCICHDSGIGFGEIQRELGWKSVEDRQGVSFNNVLDDYCKESYRVKQWECSSENDGDKEDDIERSSFDVEQVLWARVDLKELDVV